jgi:hypothetical protein
MKETDIIPYEYFTYTHNKNWLNEVLPVEVNKCIFVPEYMPMKKHFDTASGNYTVKSLGDSLAHYYLKEKLLKIVFLSHTEALSGFYLRFMNKVVNYMCNSHGFDITSFIYVPGAHPIEQNIIAYEKACGIYNIQPVTTIFVNEMEQCINDANSSASVNFDEISTTPRKKLKKFISLNGVPRLFRLVLTAQLLKYDLLKDSYYTLWLNERDRLGTTNLEHSYIEDAKLQFPLLAEETGAILRKNSFLFPMYLHTAPAGQYNQHDVFLYSTSYFSVVGETVFAENVGLQDDLFFECYDFSEKLFRPIKFKHPFILLARPHSLKVLREYGYKTFHPYINESYDSIENDEERMVAIVEEIKRLCSFNDKQWLGWQQHIKEIVEHNHAFLNNIGIKSLVYEPNIEDEE